MSDFKILSQLNSPEDLRKLPEEELPELCSEIREKLIEVVSVNGGHLASNLGVVELTVALHKTFKTPHDSIVWDVGHQSYTHKMLTGRFDKIDTIRKREDFQVSLSVAKVNMMNLMQVTVAPQFLPL